MPIVYHKSMKDSKICKKELKPKVPIKAKFVGNPNCNML